MSNVTLQHKITKNFESIPCVVWDSWKLVPELLDVYEVVPAPDGCIPCGTSSESVIADPAAKTTETQAKTASKNTSKDGE